MWRILIDGAKLHFKNNGKVIIKLTLQLRKLKTLPDPVSYQRFFKIKPDSLLNNFTRQENPVHIILKHIQVPLAFICPLSHTVLPAGSPIYTFLISLYAAAVLGSSLIFL